MQYICIGRMAEWFKASHSKRDVLERYRGFESLFFRSKKGCAIACAALFLSCSSHMRELFAYCVKVLRLGGGYRGISEMNSISMMSVLPSV